MSLVFHLIYHNSHLLLKKKNNHKTQQAVVETFARFSPTANKAHTAEQGEISIPLTILPAFVKGKQWREEIRFSPLCRQIY